MRAEGMISLINAREVISTSGKRIIPLVTSRKAVSLGKGKSFQNRFQAKLLREAQTRSYPNASYPDAKLFRTVNLHDSSAYLFQSESRIESEAELNHYGDVRISHTMNQSSSKYFGVWTSPLQTYENFKGGLVDTLKNTRFLMAWTMSNLLTFTKDKW